MDCFRQLAGIGHHVAEDTVAADRGVERDDGGGVVVGWAVLPALLGPMIVEVAGELR